MSAIRIRPIDLPTPTICPVLPYAGTGRSYGATRPARSIELLRNAVLNRVRCTRSARKSQLFSTPPHAPLLRTARLDKEIVPGCTVAMCYGNVYHGNMYYSNVYYSNVYYSNVYYGNAYYGHVWY
eukprot:356086-Rhodomonas_salina.1